MITQSGGHVGIGTPSLNPSSVLDIEGGSLGINYGASSGGASLGATSEGTELKLDFSGSHHSSLLNNQGSLQIGTADSSWYLGAPLVPLLTILGSSGNVGIRTASPRSILDVNGTPIAQSYELGGSWNCINWNLYWNGSGWNYRNSDYGGQLQLEANGSFDFITYPSGTAGSSPSSAVYDMHIANTGAVGIGTLSPSAKLEVDGNFKLTFGSGASITFADGTVQSTAYTGVSCGGDYAESVDVKGKKNAYEPGNVLVISGASGSDVEKASEPYSTMVAGIYSTKPWYVGRRQTTKDKTREIPMAMVGIVPTKVSAENGPIHRGDLLVTSSTPGYVMKGTDRG